MRMPIVVAALLAAAAPLPAVAQDAEPDMSAVTDTLSDPATQERMAHMFGMVMDVMMEMPVGQMAHSMAEATDREAPEIAPDARVRDVMGPESEELKYAMVDRVPQMMDMMGAMAGAFEAMLPQLREVADRLPRDFSETE